MTEPGDPFDAYRTIRYLDAVRRLPEVARAKARILDLLDLQLGQRALDVGCGTGEDVWALAERVGPTGSAEGVDASPWSIGEARRRADAADPRPSGSYRVGDVYALPYPAASFDAVRAERLFVHLNDPAAALRELRRVTRSGGVVLVADASFATLRLAGPPLALTERVVRHTCDRFASGRIGSALAGLFVEAGLEAVEAVAMEHVARTVTEADTLFTFAQTTAEMIHSGVAAESEVAAWQRDLARREQCGTLGWHVTGYIVCGRVPRMCPCDERGESAARR